MTMTPAAIAQRKSAAASRWKGGKKVPREKQYRYKFNRISVTLPQKMYDEFCERVPDGTRATFARKAIATAMARVEKRKE